MNKISSVIKKIRKRKIKIDHRFFIFSFFLLISTIFWILNALSKDYTTLIEYPVRYTHLPENKILLGNLPKVLQLKVKGYGFTLLKRNLERSPNPIQLSVNTFYQQHLAEKEIVEFYIKTNTLEDIISNQLRDIELVDISPDSIEFKFVKEVSKKVPVLPDISLRFRQQYMRKSQIALEPDSVLVSGPKTIVEEFDTLKTEYREFRDIDKTIETKLALKQHAGISYSSDSVKLTVPVESFIEGQLKIKIKVENLPSNLMLKVFPNYTMVSYLVGFSDWEKIKEADFEAVVDYNDIDYTRDDMKSKLKVKLSKVSDFVIPNSVSYYPRKVEYILKKSK